MDPKDDSAQEDNEGAKIGRSPSATYYLRLLDERRPQHCCKCSPEGGKRDRRYAFPKRYGERTTVTTRRVDRQDPERELY